MTRRAAVLLALLSAFPPAESAANGLPEQPRAVLAQQLVPDDAVSVVVRDVAGGESLIDMNGAVARVPASVMKIIPTYAALDILGPAYSWRTRALADGPVSGGILHGNLYLQGGGDPLMTIERWWRFVTDLRQTGLREIDGDIVVDDGMFAPIDQFPGDFDGQPYRIYNVLPNALLVNFQSVEFVVRPSSDGQAIDVAVDPYPANLEVENRIRPVSGRCAGRNRRFRITHPASDTHKVIVGGTVSVKCPPQRSRQTVLGPAEFAYGTFRQLWEQQGGSISGGLLRAPVPKSARLLLSQESLTLGEIVRATNKHSSNVMARTLVLTLAAERAALPATAAAGEKVIGQWLQGKGLDFPELAIDNGSGLSRTARISADSLASLLQSAWKSRYAPEFLATLPLGGLDGTLRKRFRRLDDPSRVRMKTGTLNDASSIAGYVTGSSGRTYVVVVMINHAGAQYGPGEAIQAAVVDWVLRQ